MSNLPPKDDPKRDELEREAIETRNKAGQAAMSLKEGKLPSNDQITRVIETVQKSDALQAPQGMSPLGKKVLADFERLLDTTKKIFEEKNVGDELQNAIYYSTKATKDVNNSVTIPDDLKKKATNEVTSTQPIVQDAFKKTLLIPQLFISSSEFRKLINDLHSIIQDALLRTIPDREPDTDVPNVGTDEEKTLQQAKQETLQQAREGTYPVAKEAANITGAHVKDFSEGKKGFQETATGGAKELATHFKSKVADYEITEEQRDQLVNRFKNAMIETQQRPEYQEVLEDLVNIISLLSDKAQSVTGQVKETAKAQAQDSADKSDLQTARESAKKLIENFANHKSLDPLINVLKDFGKDVKRDEELRSYLDELRQFVNSSLRDPKFVQETDYVDHGSKLIERGRYLLLERYSDETHRITDEIREFNSALQDDVLTTQWSKDFETLIGDLFLSENSQPTIKFELIKDFRKILPAVGERLKYLPLPRIENSDEEYDYIFDNIVLYLAEILPGHLHVNFTTDINLSRDEKDILQNTAFFEISKINADARNIAFYYKKKKGLINMMDVGLVDFSIPKNGLTIKLKVLMNPPTDNNQNIDIRVLEANTIIDDLKLRLHDTKHDFMYTLLTPLVEKRLKKQFANMITEKLVTSVDYIKDNIIKVEAQVRHQVTDIARSKVKGIAGDIKQKHQDWQTDSNPQITTQAKEE
ncbi:hypothetical protein RclHR1_01400014 [Rhizophagus clarus]|uniref:HAM1-like N-terminal domain-containing protein n=1 Tax=Rhizophagus clarus TaxID=94130 RepID=A0A2Z6QS60_9GLOM|nr:hypothetical protein RclHR1_01400014 [Rhizophagus clarus]GES95878.1 hypothetical protein GLOIN_2v1490238 [Rhizophagus clarus]